MSLSIVTPTFNRINVLVNSISSSLSLIEAGHAKELIVVDDCSSDGTVPFLFATYNKEIKAGVIKVIVLNENVGVTGAKNKGAQAASSEWIAFMDSDDTFDFKNAELMIKELERLESYGLVFFRCRDNISLTIIGGGVFPRELEFKSFINDGLPGECLPIIKRKYITRLPYYEQLRGCESLTYFDMLANGVLGFLSDVVVRNYSLEGEDRLSTKGNILKRADKLYFYNLKKLKYFKLLSMKNKGKLLLRLLYYKIHSLNSK